MLAQEPLIDEEPLVLRQRKLAEPELDITPMIDMTFLLLIFFLVTSVPDVQRALELPQARHGIAADPRTALFITLVDSGGNRPPQVYVADGRVGTPLATDETAQATALQQAAREALVQGRTSVLIKAERGVLHRHVARVAAAVASVGNLHVNIAVSESD